MKKVAAAVIVIIILAAGGYALFHKSNNTNSSKTTTSSSQATKNNAPAVNNAVLITKTDAKLGQYLADPNGRVLYTYNADSNGVSNCTGACLVNWPAYVATGSTTGLPAGVSTIKRTDNGQMQYTYNGKPLYYFTSDSPGQITGNNVENFTVAKPAAASSSSASTNASPSSTTSGNNSSSGYPY